jgi:protein-L-isoaspartate(D-aspartate) O-methyltransferase
MITMSQPSLIKPAFYQGFLLVVMGLISASLLADTAEEYEQRRELLVKEIQQNVVSTRHYIGRKALDERVMAAIGTVERHQFVDESWRSDAYENRPLPIGYGQTISQPYIVALMTDLLAPEPEDVVLEIGTGSGYQAAILSGLVKKVYSIEIIPQLGKSASQLLERLGFENIELKTADGYHGWEEHAPFDAIIVTAAASHIPPPLVQQLKPGGVLIIPVGPPFQVQQLTLVQKDNEGALTTRQILPVSFVPFTGDH